MGEESCQGVTLWSGKQFASCQAPPDAPQESGNIRKERDEEEPIALNRKETANKETPTKPWKERNYVPFTRRLNQTKKDEESVSLWRG